MADINGNTKGIKKTVLEDLEKLYELQVPTTQIATVELIEKLRTLTKICGREIVVYINRRGVIIDVAVGDASTAILSKIDSRRSVQRLSGVRCLHTHPSSKSDLSELDISSLKRLRLDCMVAISLEATNYLSIAFIGEVTADNDYEVVSYNGVDLEDFCELNFSQLMERIDKTLSFNAVAGYAVEKNHEVAILVGLENYRPDKIWKVQDSLAELKQLADTAGAKVVDSLWQKRERPDSAYYVGKGKLQEIQQICQQKNADMVIFDDELSPAQQRNIEMFLGLKIVDRTALILDIFAQRARTHEGKLQVALAQMQYNLPRIMGQGLVLSRLGGGIGTRGPGETKLETDRRYIRNRIHDIKKELEQVKKVRQLHRKQREDTGIRQVSLVGYTNAGKSTLLNSLTATDSQVYVANKLFATLDPTTRSLQLENQQEVLLTDTVGFIQKLPHQLVAAFRATLEEVLWADLLVHVVDVSHPLYKEQIASVNAVLKEIGVTDKKTIIVYNKIDLIADTSVLQELVNQENTLLISAKAAAGFVELKQLIANNLNMLFKKVSLLVPYTETAIVSKIHDLAEVLSIEYLEQGVALTVSIAEEKLPQVRNYLVQT